MFGLIL